LFPGAPDRRALAELLLERQGIVTRDGVRGEGIVGGYSAVYGELKALETLGLARRGYFVEGLGGAQFALGGAVERLRELRPKEGDEPDWTSSRNSKPTANSPTTTCSQPRAPTFFAGSDTARRPEAPTSRRSSSRPPTPSAAT
jgi:ATP-dependent Lhr-like helicase